MADGGFVEDFPSDIERKLCSEWDRVIICGRREREFVREAGRRFNGSVRHGMFVRS